MRRSQRNNHGTANSTRQSRSQNNTNRTTQKHETISRFFKRVENTQSSSTEVEAEQPGKHNSSNVSDSDFVSPPKARKLAKIFTDVKENVKRVTRSRMAKKSVVVNEEQKLLEIGRTSDVNMEHLQLAMALSKSMEPELSTCQEDNCYPSTQQITENVRLELGAFKFHTNVPSTKTTPLEQTKFRGKQKSKFRYVKPKLFTRTVEEQENIIQEKIIHILAHTIKHSQPNIEEVLNSSELQEIQDVNQRNFRLSQQEDKKTGVYYVESLHLEETSAVCGCLLRNWDSIPGRDWSPTRPTLKSINIDESCLTKSKSMKMLTNQSDIIHTDTLVSHKVVKESPVQDKCKNNVENLQNVEKSEQNGDVVEVSNQNDKVAERNKTIDQVVCVPMVTNDDVFEINKETNATPDTMEHKPIREEGLQHLDKIHENNKVQNNSNNLTTENIPNIVITRRSSSNISSVSQKSRKTVRSVSPDLFASSDEDILEDDAFFRAVTPPIEYASLGGNSSINQTLFVKDGAEVGKSSLKINEIKLKINNETTNLKADINNASQHEDNTVKVDPHKEKLEVSLKLSKINENSASVLFQCNIKDNKDNNETNNMELNAGDKENIHFNTSEDDLDELNSHIMDDNGICTYESFDDYDDEIHDDSVRTVESEEKKDDISENEEENNEINKTNEIIVTNDVLSSSDNRDLCKSTSFCDVSYNNDSYTTEINNVTRHVHALLNSNTFADAYKSICIDKYLTSHQINTESLKNAEKVNDIHNSTPLSEKQDGGRPETNVIDLSQDNIDHYNDCIDLSQDSDGDSDANVQNKTVHSFQRHVSSKSIDSTASTNESICISDEELNYSCLNATPKPVDSRMSWKYSKLAFKKNKFAISDSEDEDLPEDGDGSDMEGSINVTKLLEAIRARHKSVENSLEKSRALEKSICIDLENDEHDPELQTALELSLLEENAKKNVINTEKVGDISKIVQSGDNNVDDESNISSNCEIASVSMNIYKNRADIHQNKETNEIAIEQTIFNDSFPSFLHEISRKNVEIEEKQGKISAANKDVEVMETENNMGDVFSSNNDFLSVSMVSTDKVRINKETNEGLRELTDFNDSFPSFSHEICRKETEKEDKQNKKSSQKKLNNFTRKNNVNSSNNFSSSRASHAITKEVGIYKETNAQLREQTFFNDSFPSFSHEISRKNVEVKEKQVNKSAANKEVEVMETETNVGDVFPSNNDFLSVSMVTTDKVEINKETNEGLRERTDFNDSFPSFSHEISRKKTEKQTNKSSQKELNNSTAENNVFSANQDRFSSISEAITKEVETNKVLREQTIFNDSFPSFSHEITQKNIENAEKQSTKLPQNEFNKFTTENNICSANNFSVLSVSQARRKEFDINKETGEKSKHDILFNDSFPSFSYEIRHNTNEKEEELTNSSQKVLNNTITKNNVYSSNNFKFSSVSQIVTKELETNKETNEQKSIEPEFNHSFPSFDYNFDHGGGDYASETILNSKTRENVPEETKEETKKAFDEFDMLVDCTESIFNRKKPQCRRVQELINKTTPKKQTNATNVNTRASSTFEDTFANLLEQTNVLERLDTINNKPTICSDENTVKTPPSCKTKLVDTPKTPLDGLYVKTSNVTPMPHYDNMTTPEIHAELDKIGVKCMKRRRGVQMLKHVYNSMHLDVQDVLQQEDVDLTELSQPNKRRKKLNYDLQDCVDDNVETVVAQNDGSIDINHKLAESDPVENMIFERKQSKRIKSCALPFHIAWHNFLCVNRDIWETVLLYEPLQVEVLYAMFKDLGFKYNIQVNVHYVHSISISLLFIPVVIRAETMALNATGKLLKVTTSPLRTLVAAYHPNVIDHYENPRNVGSLDKQDVTVGTGLVGAPACGDVMKLQIKVDENGKIIDAKFKTFGCGSAIASSSLATEWVKGKSIDEAANLRNTDIAKELALPPVKLHCSMLAEDAIKAALSDYKIKQKKKVEATA